ncbi:MAG: hypothetical protein NVSMB4_10390 [Acidimicrobiales bacterium]
MAGTCAAVVAAPGAAGAVTRVERAYFFTGQQSGGILPPPANVPPKGMWVRSTAAGTQASSAIRFVLAAGETSPTLKLTVHQMAGTPQVVACPTTSTWRQGDAQPISAAPRSDCSKGPSVGGLSADGKTVTFDLSNIDTSSGRVDLALIPAPPTDASGGAVAGAPAVNPQFDITFEPLTAGSVVTAQTAAPAVPADGSAAQDSSGSASAPSSGEVTPAPSASSPAPASAPSGDALAAPLAASAGPGIGPAPFTPPATAVPTPSNANQLALAAPRRPRPIARRQKTSRVTRIVEGSALLYLLALLIPTGGLLGEWAQALSGSKGGSAKPRLTLYDGPPAPRQAIETSRAPSGAAPALR